MCIAHRFKTVLYSTAPVDYTCFFRRVACRVPSAIAAACCRPTYCTPLSEHSHHSLNLTGPYKCVDIPNTQEAFCIYTKGADAAKFIV